jgi:membrane fusion protein (multidrug efflux system)
MSSAITGRDVSDHASRRRAGRKPEALGIAALAISICMGGGWYGYDWWTTGRFMESTDDAYVGGNVTTISPHIAGFVADVPVADNQRVQMGQLLVRLDRSDFQAAFDRAQSIVSARMATLDSLKAKYVSQQSAIAQASADVEAKTAHLVFTHEDAALC